MAKMASTYSLYLITVLVTSEKISLCYSSNADFSISLSSINVNVKNYKHVVSFLNISSNTVLSCF